MEVQFAKSSNRFGVDFPAAQELPSQHKDLRVLPAKESQWTAEEQEMRASCDRC